jgi:DNA polymerase III delta subunit
MVNTNIHRPPEVWIIGRRLVVWGSSMIIILTGPDSYRSHVRLEELRAAFRRKHDSAGLNTVTLSGVTAEVGDIHAAVSASGFFASKRFVAIDPYPAKSPACPWPEMQRILKPFIESPDVIVVIRREDDSSSRRGRSVPAGISMPGAKAEPFPLLEGVDLKRWLGRELKSRQATIEPAATLLLLEALGNDTWQISRELDKLAAFAAGRPITTADVGQLVPSTEESNVFALTDALGQRQTGRAITLLRRELRLGKTTPELLGALTSHVWNLYLAKAVSLNKKPPSFLTEHYGVNPYVAKKAWSQAAHFDLDQLRRWHHQLIEIWVTQRTGIKPDIEAQLVSLFLRLAKDAA